MKKKVVQNAKEEKPKSEPEPKPVEVANQEEASTVEHQETAEKLIEIPEIDEDTRKMLLKAGFSWDAIVGAFEKINTWSQSVDARFGLIGDALSKMPTDEGIAEKLKQKLMEAQQKQRAEYEERMKNAPKGEGGLGMNDIATLIKIVGGSGGGGDDEFSKMAKTYALESMALGNSFQKIMMAKMAPELADKLLEGISKTTPPK